MSEGALNGLSDAQVRDGIDDFFDACFSCSELTHTKLYQAACASCEAASLLYPK